MTINLYTPTDPHKPGFILADRDGLIRLKEAIEKALKEGHNTYQDFDSDGKHYNVILINEPATRYKHAPYISEYQENNWAWQEVELLDKNYKNIIDYFETINSEFLPERLATFYSLIIDSVYQQCIEAFQSSLLSCIRWNGIFITQALLCRLEIKLIKDSHQMGAEIKQLRILREYATDFLEGNKNV